VYNNQSVTGTIDLQQSKLTQIGIQPGLPSTTIPAGPTVVPARSHNIRKVGSTPTLSEPKQATPIPRSLKANTPVFASQPSLSGDANNRMGNLHAAPEKGAKPAISTKPSGLRLVNSQTSLSAANLQPQVQSNIQSRTESPKQNTMLPINSQQRPTKPPPRPPVPPTPRAATCRALYDYQSTRPDEMSIHTGQVITISKKDSSGWWEGTCGSSKGLFPAK